MTITTLLKRLDRIEAKRGTGDVLRVVGFRPLTDDEAADAVANWRAWVADGRATRTGSTLFIQAPVLTVEEWAERYSRGDTPLCH